MEGEVYPGGLGNSSCPVTLNNALD